VKNMVSIRSIKFANNVENFAFMFMRDIDPYIFFMLYSYKV